jgi:autotransporter-associated beta strand protein
MKNRINLLVGSLAVISMTPSIQAASATWNGTTNAVRATDTNWSALPAPGPGGTATFNNAGGAVDFIDLGAGVTIASITFDAAAAAYTIGSGAVGSQTLTLNDNATISATSAVATNQLFNAKVVLGTDATAQTYTITNSSATNALTVAGAVSGGTGGTAATNGVVKLGAGTLTLPGPNSYTGNTNVSAGILSLGNGTANTALADTADLIVGASAVVNLNFLAATSDSSSPCPRVA